jgi:hypothetical protein
MRRLILKLMLTLWKVHAMKTHLVPPLFLEMKTGTCSMTFKQNNKCSVEKNRLTCLSLSHKHTHTHAQPQKQRQYWLLFPNVKIEFREFVPVRGKLNQLFYQHIWRQLCLNMSPSSWNCGHWENGFSCTTVQGYTLHCPFKTFFGEKAYHCYVICIILSRYASMWPFYSRDLNKPWHATLTLTLKPS